MNNEVFILGAGFSKWFDKKMPLLNDLITYLNPSTVKKINNDSALSRLCNDEENFEKLLSYLTTRYPWKTVSEYHNHQSIYWEVLNSITCKLLDIQEELDYKLLQDSIKYKFFQYIYETNSKILTFNYDNILEKGLRANFYKGSWYKFYDLPIKNLNIRSQSSSSSGVLSQPFIAESNAPKIIKLHGSVNWLFNGSYGDISSESVYYYIPNKKESESIKINKQGLSNLIIPPSLEKNSFINHIILRCLWQNAKDILKDSNKINIIGYSFPQSDIYVDLFMKSSINKNVIINVIDINSSSDFRKRISSYFEPILKNNNSSLNFFVGLDCMEKFINNELEI